MFDRYTENARRVIFFARYEASQYGAPEIGSEHLLLGILHDNTYFLNKLTDVPDPAVVIRQELSNQLRQKLGSGPKVSHSVELPLSKTAMAVLSRTHEESNTLGHKHVGPEHLLLGLIDANGSLAAEVLKATGITRASILNLPENYLPRVAGKPALVQQLSKSLFDCLEETFTEVQGIYLDKGTSLFETLAGVSAAEASQPIAANCATLAAQVEHIRFYLEVLDNMIRSRKVAKVDWKEIWETVREVTPEEWEDQQQRLRETYYQAMTTLKAINRWEDEYEIGGALSILTHTAYHLGGIRQALAAIRSRNAGQ